MPRVERGIFWRRGSGRFLDVTNAYWVDELNTPQAHTQDTTYILTDESTQAMADED